MNTVSVSKTWYIPDEVVETILEMAGYGIGYWASEAIWNQEKRTYEVYEAEYGDMYRVTYSQIAQAAADVAYNPDVRVSTYIQDYVRELFDELDRGEAFPGGSIDSVAADVIVQYAIFGEIVYG